MRSVEVDVVDGSAAKEEKDGRAECAGPDQIGVREEEKDEPGDMIGVDAERIDPGRRMVGWRLGDTSGWQSMRSTGLGRAVSSSVTLFGASTNFTARCPVPSPLSFFNTTLSASPSSHLCNLLQILLSHSSNAPVSSPTATNRPAYAPISTQSRLEHFAASIAEPAGPMTALQSDMSRSRGMKRRRSWVMPVTRATATGAEGAWGQRKVQVKRVYRWMSRLTTTPRCT